MKIIESLGIGDEINKIKEMLERFEERVEIFIKKLGGEERKGIIKGEGE